MDFLPFRPGLVGGHCIGVDPYYLTHKADYWLLPPDHSGWAALERWHGRLCRFTAHQGDDQEVHSGRGREGVGDGPYLQGKLP